MKEYPYYDWKRAYYEDFGVKKKENTAITKGQRNWILGAWDTIYHAPKGKHACVGWSDEAEFGLVITYREKVQVHHVLPQRYGQRVEGMSKQELSEPQNLIPTTPEFHVGKGYKGSLDHRNELVPLIHADIAWAFTHYKGKTKPTSFSKVFKGRNKVVERGERYWNEDWDLALAQRAEEVYLRYSIIANEPYPI